MKTVSNFLKKYSMPFYLILMFVIFPLYLEDHYWEIGTCKWKIYLCITIPLVMIGGIAICLMAKWKKPTKWELPYLIYGTCVILSFLFTARSRDISLLGEDGWYMGVLAQLLFVLSYLVLSRLTVPDSFFLGCMCLGSGVVCIIGILQRLGFNLFYLYYGMTDVVKSDFLSTIGNRTWLSGYLVLLFPMGAYLFICAKSPLKRILWESYTILLFNGIVATYSDSAYIGVGTALFVLFLLCLSDQRKLVSFGKLLCTLPSSAATMILLRMPFGDKVRDARGITCYFYEMKWMALATIFSLLVLALLYWSRAFCEKHSKIIRITCLTAAGLGAMAFVGFIALNTTGVWEQWFGYTVQNRYLIFNEAWGDDRGFIWRLAVKMYSEFSVPEKLLGVGADGFSFVAYMNASYAAQLHQVFGDDFLINAHNEWLNMFLCQGLLGGISYLGIFVMTAIRFIKNKKNPIAIAMGVSALVYISHNFFCYQQICATGVIFVMLGIGASLENRE